MEHIHARKANSFKSSQEIPRIWWNQEIHYRIHKCSTPAPILSQRNPAHASPSHFLKFHFNIILPYMPRSCKWSLSIRCLHQTVRTTPVPLRATCPAHLILPDILWRVKTVKRCVIKMKRHWGKWRHEKLISHICSF